MLSSADDAVEHLDNIQHIFADLALGRGAQIEKIQQFHFKADPLPADHDVVFVDVAVVFAAGVDGGDAFGQVVKHVQGFEGAEALVGLLDWHLPMQQALALPNLVARGGAFNAEVDAFAPGVVAALDARGMHLVKGFGEDSGLHGIEAVDGGLEGGADPRREGVARGF